MCRLPSAESSLRRASQYEGERTKPGQSLLSLSGEPGSEVTWTHAPANSLRLGINEARFIASTYGTVRPKRNDAPYLRHEQGTIPSLPWASRPIHECPGQDPPSLPRRSVVFSRDLRTSSQDPDAMNQKEL